MHFHPRTNLFYLSPEKGGSGGPGGGGGPNAGEPGEESGDGGGTTPEAETPKSEERTFSQAEVDRIISERLERERRKREADAQKERERAEATLLKEKEDYKALAEKQEAKIATLEKEASELAALKEQHAKYEAALRNYLERERKGLPAHLTALLDKLDVVEQLEYIAAHAEEISKPKAKGVPETPAPTDKNQALTEAQKEAAGREAAAFYRGIW